MEQHKEISSMRAGETVQSFYLIKTVEVKSSNNNKKYLDFTLIDQSGEINAKLWDCGDVEQQYPVHAIIKVKGTVVEWQNKLQLKIDRIRLAAAEDGIVLADFVPTAPQDPEFMYQQLMDCAAAMDNTDIGLIVQAILTEKKEKLLIYPAAKQNHHAIRSGLLYHILTMLETGRAISQVYPLLDQDLLFAGIILHDIAKLDEMNAGELGLVSEYTVEGELLGHIVQGIKLIDRTATALGASPEVSLLLQHMVLSHHYEPDFGSPKRPMIPEAEILHYLDIIDARMYDMHKVLAGTEPGHLSDKVWLLNNRKLYKPARPESGE